MIVSLIRKTLAEVQNDGKDPVAWLVGIDFLAAFENCGVVVSVRRPGSPAPTDEEIRRVVPNAMTITRNAIGGIPFVCSPYVQSNKAFLMDGHVQCSETNHG